MTETYTIAATVRPSAKKSARDARNAGRVPGVIYGKGVEPTVISMGASDILRTFRKAGHNSLVEVEIDGKKTATLIHELNLHPVSDTIYHVDFLAVNMKEKVVAAVPVTFVGESPAVKVLGGTFLSDHASVEIRCLPADIPSELEIDISVLKEIHDHVCVRDLGLDPKKFEVMNLHEGDVLCSVTGHSATEENETSTEGEEAAEAPAAE